ncbi:MFS general substrate transporter [Flagelloscypha sp. PMI_526]|nr:MFS general substrate transporter [Flagelloscypha sp. PMI_526]
MATSSPQQDNSPAALSVRSNHDELPATTELPPDTNHLKDGLTDQTNFLPRRQLFLAFIGLSAALGCSFLDQTIVSTALASISSDLNGGRDSSWVATAYLLTRAFAPLYGRWSDVFGRKTVLVSSLIIFWVFSLACALSRTMIQLIIFRALKGIGGGATATMVVIYVGDLVPLSKRGRYQALLEVVSTLCNGLGPVLGGIFSQSTTWRWCFWINLPICGFAIVSIIFLIPPVPVQGNLREKFMKIDYLGSGCAILASTLFLLGLTWGGNKYPWVSAAVLVPLISSGVLTALFLLWESRWAKLPIIPIHIFTNVSLIGCFIGTCMGSMTLFVILYYIPQYVQLLRGGTPIQSGTFMLAFFLVTPCFVVMHGFIVDHTGRYKPSIVFGYFVWTIAQGVATTFDEHTSNAKIAGILALMGFASAGTWQTMTIAVQAAVPRSEMAVTTGVRSFLRLLASAVGLAIGSALINNTLRASLEQANISDDQITTILDDPTSINGPGLNLTQSQHSEILHAYTVAFQRVFYMTVAFCGFATIAVLLLMKQFPLDRAEEKQLKANMKQKWDEKKQKEREKKQGKDLEKGKSSEVVLDA